MLNNQKLVDAASETKPSGPRSEWPDSYFAVIDTSKSTGKENGKTKSDLVKHLPHHYREPGGADNGSVSLPLLRDALARMNQISGSPELKARAKAHLIRHAKAVLPNSEFSKADYFPNFHDVMNNVIIGHMSFNQALASLEATISDFEDLMVEHFNKKEVLPVAAFAIDKIFPHHNKNVKNSNEHGTVNKTLLKFQMVRIQSSNIPIAQKLMAKAHLLGHARVIFPQSRFVQENLAIQQTMSNGMCPEVEMVAYVEGITDESNGHTHSYTCSMNEDGNCIGETRATSNGEDHMHLFSGKMQSNETMQTGGPDLGNDHKHMIDFNKKKDKINRQMPEMITDSVENKTKNKKDYREIQLGRMKIFLRK